MGLYEKQEVLQNKDPKRIERIRLFDSSYLKKIEEYEEIALVYFVI